MKTLIVILACFIACSCAQHRLSISEIKRDVDACRSANLEPLFYESTAYGGIVLVQCNTTGKKETVV